MADAPVVDEGCIDAARSGYTYIFKKASSLDVLTWLTFDAVQRKFKVNVSLDEFIANDRQTIDVQVEIVPSFTGRATYTATMKVVFGDIKKIICTASSFIMPVNLPVLET